MIKLKMDEKKVEIYYDHYKESFSYLREYIKERDRFFVIALILLLFLSFQIGSPNQASQILNSLIQEKTGLSINVSFHFINSILLFSFMSVIIKYFQTNLLIQRQYPYIHNIEEKLSENMESFEISREGKAYLGSYPLVSSFIHRIYTIIFPISLIVVIVVKWLQECRILSDYQNGFLVFDSLICLIVVICTILYLLYLHSKVLKKIKVRVNKVFLSCSMFFKNLLP